MAVFNIIDNRSNATETSCDVVLEVDNQDWASMGLKRDTKDITEWVDNTSIYDAIFRACKFRGNVTVHLYDPNKVKSNVNQLVVTHPNLKPKSMDYAKVPEKALQVF